MHELDRRFASRGFSPFKDKFYGNRYDRPLGSTRQSIGVGASFYIGAVEAEVSSVSVRFEEVETLVARFEKHHPLITPTAIAVRSTLFVQLADVDRGVNDPLSRWGGSTKHVWLIRPGDDIAGTAEQIVAYAITKGEPLLSELSDPERALQLLCGDDVEGRSYAGPDDIRAKKAVAMTLLMHGKKAATRLADAKISRLKGEAKSGVRYWTDRLFEQS